jgi:hypothetical protein
VEIAVELKEREGQSVLATARSLVQHKKVPFDENSVRSRVRKWYHDVEENLKLPETGGKRDLATKMAYSNVTAWGQVGKPTMESKSDFEAWMRTMTADAFPRKPFLDSRPNCGEAGRRDAEVESGV